MTTLVESGTQVLQSWFSSLGLNQSGSQSESPTPAPSPELPDFMPKGLALSQNLWLKAVKVSISLFHQTVSLGALNPLASFDPSTWHQLYDSTLGSLTRIPLLGPGRESSHILLQFFDAWVQMYPAGAVYQNVLADIHRRSFEAFLDALIALTDRGVPLTDWMQLQQIWSRTADRIFDQALGSHEALRARGQFLNAMNHYKLRQQEVMELYLTALNLPTRGEVDDIHHTLYELRKEVKRLKKALPGDIS
jgi:class III poly(R)-hydroxyalkanoic acid synthase PhaE subunit